MLPQVAALGPNPSADTSASVRTSPGSSRKTAIVTIPKVLGPMCLRRRCSRFAPRDRAALTYSVCFSRTTSPRTRRAVVIQLTMASPKTSVEYVLPCRPKTATRLTRIAKRGRANAPSSTRIITLSIRPPTRPAIDP